MIRRWNFAIPIPISEMAHETLTWLNADFTERVLRFAELDSTIHVTDIVSKAATAVGDNYASDLVRVTADFTRKEGKTRVKEKKSLLFKFEPIAEGPRKEMVNTYKWKFFKDTFPSNRILSFLI